MWFISYLKTYKSKESHVCKVTALEFRVTDVVHKVSKEYYSKN